MVNTETGGHTHPRTQKHTQVRFDLPRALCVFDSRLFSPLKTFFFFFFFLLCHDPAFLIGRLVTCNAARICFYVSKWKQPPRWEKSRLIWNSTEKHVCMSPCLHWELRIHEHRCFFFTVHTHTCLTVLQTALLQPVEETHSWHCSGETSLKEILLRHTTIKGKLKEKKVKHWELQQTRSAKCRGSLSVTCVFHFVCSSFRPLTVTRMAWCVF